MNLLSSGAEKLLLEILEHSDSEGNCDTNYWKKRFENISNVEDVSLRSLFKELKEADMISIFWADNYPYQLFVLANGNTYFKDKQSLNEMEKNQTYINNFYGNTANIKIQQGNIHSSQIIDSPNELSWDKVEQLIKEVKEYDAVLENEYGKQDSEKLRKSESELMAAAEKKDVDKTKTILMFMRDLSVNASGGLIASGILQAISSILR